MCGIVGAYNIENAAQTTMYMLLVLQHRGQGGTKIAATTGTDAKINVYGDLGLITDVYKGKQWQNNLPGKFAIGHNRYPTSGDNDKYENLQPLLGMVGGNSTAIAHNGNLTNFNQLRNDLENNGSLFHTTVDTEIFLHLLHQELLSLQTNSEILSRSHRLLTALTQTCKRIRGGFALLLMTSQKEMIAITDPDGLRPLAMAKKDDGWLFASEKSAFQKLEVDKVQEIQPGKIILLDQNGLTEQTYSNKPEQRHCSFEHVYFASPSTSLNGMSTYLTRQDMAKILAQHPDIPELDTVIAVPDSSNIMTIAFGEARNIPRGYGLKKNHYIGRTFIANRADRQKLLELKFEIIKEAVVGKKVGVMDDSLVHGTTAKYIVKILRDAGVKEIHWLIASPKVVYPCDMGINTPDIDELLAYGKTNQEIAEAINANSIHYLLVDELLTALKDPTGKKFCTTCFTGIQPTKEIGEDQQLLRQRKTFTV